LSPYYILQTVAEIKLKLSVKTYKIKKSLISATASTAYIKLFIWIPQINRFACIVIGIPGNMPVTEKVIRASIMQNGIGLKVSGSGSKPNLTTIRIIIISAEEWVIASVRRVLNKSNS